MWLGVLVVRRVPLCCWTIIDQRAVTWLKLVPLRSSARFLFLLLLPFRPPLLFSFLFFLYPLIYLFSVCLSFRRRQHWWSNSASDRNSIDGSWFLCDRWFSFLFSDRMEWPVASRRPRPASLLACDAAASVVSQGDKTGPRNQNGKKIRSPIEGHRTVASRTWMKSLARKKSQR